MSEDKKRAPRRLAFDDESSTRNSGGRMNEETHITLSTLEQHLAVLQDIESEIAPEQEAEFQLALHEALTKVAEKRDRVAFVIEELLRQVDVAEALAASYTPMVERAEARMRHYAAAARRLSNHVLAVMRTLPKPAKGPRKLEGATSTLKANGVAPSVEVLDESQVPLEYKRVTVKMSARKWLLVCEAFGAQHPDSILSNVNPSYEVDRTALLEALKRPCAVCGGKGDLTPKDDLETRCDPCNGTGKQLIPGARLDDTKLRLVIE